MNRVAFSHPGGTPLIAIYRGGTWFESTAAHQSSHLNQARLGPNRYRTTVPGPVGLHPVEHADGLSEWHEILVHEIEATDAEVIHALHRQSQPESRSQVLRFPRKRGSPAIDFGDRGGSL
jgi:hypothetical protein